MDIFLPENIFSKILSRSLKNHASLNFIFVPAALLSKKLSENKEAISLIPTMDLINHPDFYVSRKVGITFDESISNSYIYFKRSEDKIKEIVLAGDVSSNEGILTKILFNETYEVEVELLFEKINGGTSSQSQVLVGDRNFIEGNLSSAISFTEEIIELISAPYVNFVLASQSELKLKELHSKYFDLIASIIASEIFEEIKNNYPLDSQNYLIENLQHVMFNFDEQDIEGIKSLLQLPYFHGIIGDLIEVKFV